MKKYRNIIIMGTVLIGLSMALHMLHFAIFNDLHHIMIFLVADIAFIPLEVFFVSIVLERIIEKRDRDQVMRKLSMLVGLFYQEVGNELLNMLVSVDECDSEINDVKVNFTWSEKEYHLLSEKIKNHDHKINVHKVDFSVLFDLLKENKSMITQLIVNPTLHEHESFSEVLMSMIHLFDELKQRGNKLFSDDDYSHLKVDVERVYSHLSEEWVSYMNRLQVDYPYLFLTAIKSNPYDSRCSSVIEKEALVNYS